MKNKQEKVLIAEDDLFISEVYFAKLSSEGFDVTLADNGEDALKKIEQLNPDVVLLDILMPKMDGWEVLNRIRQDNKNKDVIVIMLTNVGDKEAIDKALKAGANDYFIKSFFTPEEIVSKIRGLLEKK
ncbi:MAG: response regulator transcription factor [Patescibacteria group bacterium]|jgi:CheY-like chemotaxis protein|nr:response regulator transcription factor [Patescibacteria group bacterium]